MTTVTPMQAIEEELKDIDEEVGIDSSSQSMSISAPSEKKVTSEKQSESLVQSEEEEMLLVRD